MKKIIAIILCLTLTASFLAACGSKKEEAYKGPEGKLTEIFEKLYKEHKKIDLAIDTADLDLKDKDRMKYETGITDSLSLVKEAAASDAMINAQAYALALVRVKDAKDTETVAKEMLKNIDPMRWVCVGADDVKVVTCGDTILLIMVSSAFSEMMTSKTLATAFQTVCEGHQDSDLSK